MIPAGRTADTVSACYYVNVDRLAGVYERCLGQSLTGNAPVWFAGETDCYDCLWANKHNSLGWSQLLELRGYLENCVRELIPHLVPLDLSLIEQGLVEPTASQGEYLAFNCRFAGRDVPDQAQLVECRGDLDGPPGTLRRERISNDDDLVFETCMLLNPRFFYSDSAFFQLSEESLWCGVGICGTLRKAVGSNDGHRLRSQLLVTPLWIGRSANTTVR